MHSLASVQTSDKLFLLPIKSASWQAELASALRPSLILAMPKV